MNGVKLLMNRNASSILKSFNLSPNFSKLSVVLIKITNIVLVISRKSFK